MLHFPTPDPEDQKLLEDSYKVIGRKTSLEIISDKEDLGRVYKTIVNSVSLPDNCHFTIANLFKITATTGYFYIAQTLQDFGYSQTGRQTIRDEYRYQVIGMAKPNADFGTVAVRPKVWADRLVGKLFKSNISVTNSKLFNSRHRVTAEYPEKALKLLGPQTVEAMSTVEGLHLNAQKDYVFVWFEDIMTQQHSARIEGILLTLACLAD